MTTEQEAKASFLAGAAIAETAMREGPQKFRPFAGPNAPGPTQVWQEIFTEGEEAELWPLETLGIDDDCIDRVLPSVQRTFSRFHAERRSTALLESFASNSLEGLKNCARIRSCACRASAIWVDTLPTSPAYEMV